MSCEQTPRNAFRSTVLGHDPESPIVAKKRARLDPSGEGLEGIGLDRKEARCTNQRSGDRQLHSGETVTVRRGRQRATVGLINLSGGGAMIEGELNARLWDRLTLVLGDHGEVECAVRWVRGNRFGLEFAHETRIDCSAALRDETLRQVLEENFADSEEIKSDDSADEEVPELAGLAETLGQRQQARHPLIWSGMIHQHHDSLVARLRNISAGGALVQSTGQYSPGTDVVLDLGNAGTIDARISWSRGDQAGLEFKAPFDLRKLAACKPEVAERRWAKPEYLRDESVETSPWASQWGRLTLKELSRTLAG